MSAHVHRPLHFARTNGGTVFEVCACGAVRTNGGAWHACRLCSHEVRP